MSVAAATDEKLVKVGNAVCALFHKARAFYGTYAKLSPLLVSLVALIHPNKYFGGPLVRGITKHTHILLEFLI